jgi:hypothetical protein
MDGYLKEKSRCHQAINSTFIQFSMRHVADQMAVGLKAMVDSLKASVTDLEKKVKAQESDGSRKITQEMFNRLESKLSNVIAANGLEKNDSRNN